MNKIEKQEPSLLKVQQVGICPMIEDSWKGCRDVKDQKDKKAAYFDEPFKLK